MKLYVFWTIPLSIIGSLFTLHSAMVYAKQVCKQLSSRIGWSCSKAVYKLVSIGQRNCPKHVVSDQNKFTKLVHLVGFIIKKFVTMHGHMNVKE